MQPRFNGFEFIHKGLRGLLFDTAINLQRTHFGNSKEVNISLEKVEKVLWIYERHAHHENTFVFPMVEKVDPVAAKRFFAEHDEDERLSHELKKLITAYSVAGTTEEQLKIGAAIKMQFSDFIAFNLTHMNNEERILNPILWKHYSDQEIMSMNAELRKTIPPDENMFTLEWIFRSVSPQEVDFLLSSMKPSLPEPVYEEVFQLAQRVVSMHVPA